MSRKVGGPAKVRLLDHTETSVGKSEIKKSSSRIIYMRVSSRGDISRVYVVYIYVISVEL